RHLGERERQIEDQIVALALESVVIPYVEHDQQVAGRTVSRPGRALPAERQVVVGGDAGRDLDGDRLAGSHPPLASADLARLEHNAALARAGGTGRHAHELPE